MMSSESTGAVSVNALVASPKGIVCKALSDRN
jgi:hypothetical protein